MTEWHDGYDQAMWDCDELDFTLSESELLILHSALTGLIIGTQEDPNGYIEEIEEMKQLRDRLAKQLRILMGFNDD
jgi:hypothetical protein